MKSAVVTVTRHDFENICSFLYLFFTSYRYRFANFKECYDLINLNCLKSKSNAENKTTFNAPFARYKLQ